MEDENKLVLEWFKKKIKKQKEEILKSIGLMTCIVLFLALIDTLLLFYIIPKTNSVEKILLLCGGLILWYLFLFQYGENKIGKPNLFQYERQLKDSKKIYFKTILPLLIMEIGIIILLYLPERPSHTYVISGKSTMTVFDLIGSCYMDGILKKMGLRKWYLILILIGPIVMWLVANMELRKQYKNAAVKKIYEIYKEMDQIYFNGQLNDFLQKNPNDFKKQLKLQKEQMELVIEEAAQERIRNDKLKMELVTNISHDLKTPLTAIFNYLEIMRHQNSLEGMKIYLENTFTSCETLKEMIEKLFCLSKANSGAEKLDLQVMEMNCLLEQICSDMEDLAEQADTPIKKQLSSEELHFSADGRYAYSICQNLLENAMKYSLKGTRIYIRTRKLEENQIQLEVINTSSYEMNFDEEEIVERFVRGDVARTTEGNGLGLAIVKAYTEACGGSLQISVDGDQFKATVTFPIVEKK